MQADLNFGWVHNTQGTQLVTTNPDSTIYNVYWYYLVIIELLRHQVNIGIQW